MFNKKREIPLLTYFILKVNLTALNNWVSEPIKIKPTSDNDWGNSRTKEYKITLLPNETFTFYHNNANEFSPSIGGLDILENDKASCIEWAWNQSYFYVSADHPRITVFSVPLDEIFHLMKTGENLSTKLPRDEDVISLDSDEKYDEVYRDRSSYFALFYSNELISLKVICASANDLVNYE